MKPRHLFFAAIVLLISATSIGWYAGTRSAHKSTSIDISSSNRKVLYWHDPMVPGPKFDKPGKSPFMDMDLVPVYEDESSSAQDASVVTVRPEIVNSLGVRTAAVQRGRSGVIHIPREALIRTGQRNAVIVSLGAGRFKPVDVIPGREVGDSIEITQGLTENDRVVVSGQFLIDSEASTRASFQRMLAPDTNEEKKP